MDDLIKRAQRRIAQVNAEHPTDDDSLICDLLIALREKRPEDWYGTGQPVPYKPADGQW